MLDKSKKVGHRTRLLKVKGLKEFFKDLTFRNFYGESI